MEHEMQPGMDTQTGPDGVDVAQPDMGSQQPTPVEPDPVITRQEPTPLPMAELEQIQMQASAPDRMVRKSVLDLTQEEKQRFVNAFLKLNQTFIPGSEVSILGGFALLHTQTNGFAPDSGSIPGNVGTGPAVGTNITHGFPNFAPWHRELVSRFENELQKIDPTVTVPYWDFTDPKTLEVMFAPDFLGSNGEGGNYTIQSLETGQPQVVVGGEVKTGLLTKENGYVLDPRVNSSPFDVPEMRSRGDALVRYLFTRPFDKLLPKKDVEDFMKLDDPSLFISALEGNVKVKTDANGNLLRDANGNIPFDLPRDGLYFFSHNYIHDFVGGSSLGTDGPRYVSTMNSLSAPYDPSFWMLHSNLERLWAEWQVKEGHYGDQFYPTYNPTVEGKPHYGQNANDLMWPWDGNESTPAYILGPVEGLPPIDLKGFLRNNFSDQFVRAADPLDFVNRYDFTYDSILTRTGSQPDVNFGTLFNAAYYMDTYADVAAAVKSGTFSSAWDHFSKAGYMEGRTPSKALADYVAQNGDVASAVASGAVKSGAQHFFKSGIHEARGLSTQMAGLEEFYLNTNSDVAQAVQQNSSTSGLEHLVLKGMAEGRNPFPEYKVLSETFDPVYYQVKNPDVSAAVQSGQFLNFFQHYLRTGMDEGRDPSLVFRSSTYFAQNPDVQAAVSQGLIKSASEHLMNYGLDEGRAVSTSTAANFKASKTVAGTAGDDVVTGGYGDDVLVAGAGDDLLDGGAGNDMHTGGAGRDLFVLASGMGTDTVTDFAVGQDRVGLVGLTFGQLAFAQGTGANAADALIRVAGTNEVIGIVQNAQASALTADQFVVAY